jgi:cytochrome c556
MRRFVIGAAVALTMGLGTSLLAQGKITSPEEYAKVMKSNGQTVGAIGKAVKSGAFADAKGQVSTLRQNYMMLQDFWGARKFPDAQGFVKAGLAGIDALDKALSAPTPDPTAVQAAVKQVQTTCGGCHMAQREGDQASGFKFKPGVF